MRHVFYRGQYGGEPGLISKLGAISLTDDRRVAEVYAKYPNVRDVVIGSNLFTVICKGNKAYLNQPRDGYVDVEYLIKTLGLTIAKWVLSRLLSYVKDTNAYQERFKGLNPYTVICGELDGWRDLCVAAYAIFDDSEIVRTIQGHGYDHAIYMGCGAGSMTVEYRAFSPDILEIISKETLM